MSTDLKPCPFCAGTATLDDERLIFVARCTGCGACVLGERAPEPEEDLPDGYWEPFRQSTIDRWNRRAALAQPEPVGPSMPAAISDMPEQQRWYVLGWQAALARWGRPTITPTPVSERLPGAEDCDAEGRCWMLGKVESDWRLISTINPGVPKLSYCFSHWLPFHALPLPAAVDAPGA